MTTAVAGSQDRAGWLRSAVASAICLAHLGGTAIAEGPSPLDIFTETCLSGGIAQAAQTLSKWGLQRHEAVSSKTPGNMRSIDRFEERVYYREGGSLMVRLAQMEGTFAGGAEQRRWVCSFSYPLGSGALTPAGFAERLVAADRGRTIPPVEPALVEQANAWHWEWKDEGIEVEAGFHPGRFDEVAIAILALVRTTDS